MSFVDSAINVYCGDAKLGSSSIPVYWVLSDNFESENNELITKNDLLIGGGSGEHPAMHIKNVDFLAASFILDKLESKLSDYDFDKESEFIEKLLIQRLNKRDNNKKIEEDIYINIFNNQLYYNISDWPISSISEIQKSFVDNSFTKDNTAETYFLNSIAFWAIKNMHKNIYSGEIYEFIQKHINNIEMNEKQYFHISLKNNYTSGKNIKNNQVVWGYNLNDYKNEQLIFEEKKLLDDLTNCNTLTNKTNKI